MTIEEPPVRRKTISVKDFWKRYRTKKKIEVSSGPPPTFEELPPINPRTGEPTTTQDQFMDIVDRTEEDDKKG